MKKILTVTIGIPAYQSEKNIGQLLDALLKQRQKEIIVENILVYTDACTDRTIEEVKKFKNPVIKLFIGRANKGYAGSLQYLIEKNRSRVFVGLNDDIKIVSDSVIENLVKPFLLSSSLGMTCGDIVALTPKTFVAKCIYASYSVFQYMKHSYRDGNNAFTVDGKIFAIEKSFSKKIKLNKIPTGNTDIFIYFLIRKHGLGYQFVKNSWVLFRLPETLADFKNQEERAKASYSLMKKYFGAMVDEEWGIPKKEYCIAIARSFIRFPLHSLSFKFFKLTLSLSHNSDFRSWRLAETTKQL